MMKLLKYTPLMVFMFVPCLAWALPAVGSSPLPHISLEIDGAGTGVSDAMKIIILITTITLAPALLMSMTCFTRLIVVFSFMRQAMGTHQMPPTQILMGLALFLTIFIMGPTLTQLNDLAFQPFMAGEISEVEAFDRAKVPLRKFMLRQTRESDLELFFKVTHTTTKPNSIDDVSMMIIVPAYVLSELKTGFQMGFMVFVPFLVVDMITASTLMAMGMMMLPPIIISLPIKIALFILADGWHLLVASLIDSFQINS